MEEAVYETMGKYLFSPPGLGEILAIGIQQKARRGTFSAKLQTY